MSDFADLFINTSKPVIKNTFVCNEADWLLVKSVFLEPGFRSYFPGFVIKILADALRQNNIGDVYARFRHPATSSIGGLLSNLRTAVSESITNGRCYPDGVLEKGANHPRVATDVQEGGNAEGSGGRAEETPSED